MYTVDLLPVENEDSVSTKSGDAIVLNFTVPSTQRNAVVVIDGGYTATGTKVAEHVKQYCGTGYVDLVICTHPDSDHINGLITLLDTCDVGELMMHLPWNYAKDANVLGNYEKIVELYDLAVSKNIKVTQPFTGETRFSGAVRILGPSESRYIALLADAIEEEREGVAAERRGLALSGSATVLTKARSLIERAVALLPIETLSNADDTSPRNQTSAITLLDVDAHRHMLTGDAGIASLDAAVDHYESIFGPISSAPLCFFQAPHHGSHHNLGPAVLNRILGAPGKAFATVSGYISSAKASEKHPSPKVVNALIRRGAKVYATEGSGICHYSSGFSRDGWVSLTPLPPLEEED